MSDDQGTLDGVVTWELRGPDGELKRSGTAHNKITDVGDVCYAQRGSGAGSPAAAPTGMRLGTGSTAPSKSGAGAALVTRLVDGNQAFDSTFPSVVSNAGAGAVATYKVTYAAGKATSASTAITEAVIVNDTIATDTATAAANTTARVLLTGIGSKQSTDTLTITWTHTLLGS